MQGVTKGSDLPWEVTPESVASVPPPLPPAPAEPPAPRRTPTHTFRLLDEETEPAPPPPAPRKGKRKKRRGSWLSRLALLLVIGAVGAGAYWYFVLRDPGAPPPWAGLVDRVKRLVARSPAPPPPPAARRTTPRPPPAATPAPVPPAAETPFARFDRLSDSLSRSVRSFHDRAALFTAGRSDCPALARGLASIENLWITYNAERRARIASFDGRRTAQDQALYASVDSVESRFEQSGCSRP
jgi:hypothetical protein